MGTKTIVASITVHKPGQAFEPFKFSDSGVVTAGKYDVEEVPPGTPVDLDEGEADRLIRLGFAEPYEVPDVAAVKKESTKEPVTGGKAK